MIEFKKVSKKYDRILFKDFNFKFEDKGFYLIKGNSGSGKSTILNMISGLDKDYEGDILFDNHSLKGFSNSKLARLRMDDIGFIFQSFNLFENDTVSNNILITLNTLDISKKEKDYKLYEILNRLGLIKLKDTLVSKLSGGEKQRVALARSLVKSPKVLLADEPTGALDFKNSKKIFKILKSISQDILVIVVTHDEYFSNLFGSNILYFNNQKIEYKNIVNEHNPKFVVLNFKNKYKRKYSLSLKFIFNRFKESFKSNKKMNAFIVSMCSISLFLFGLTLTINQEIGNLIINSFSSLCGENSLILESKSSSEVKDYYGASKDDLINIYKTYSDIDEIGCFYLNDFNNFFVESNACYFVNQFNSLIEIPKLNMNNFINYNYVKNVNSIKTFNKIEKYHEDSIILGIDNESMLQITSNLRIKNTYQALSDFLFSYNPYIVLRVENDYWTYDDELIIDLIGITQASSNTIYSSELFYNEYLLEDLMRFPSTLEIYKESEYPWDLKKLYYFKSENKVDLIKEISLSGVFNDLSFDSSFRSDDKVALMHNVSSGLKESDLKIINDNFNINSYYYSTDFGYINYGSIMAGFSKPTFISSSSAELEKIIDKDNKIEYEDYYYLNDSETILRGNYLISDKSKVTLSSNFSKEINGKYPENYKNIAISKGIANKFNFKIGDQIYLGTFTKLNKENNKINGEFNIASFRVSGITNESKNILYQDGYFSIALYRDLFNISPINLNISNITFFLDNKIDKSTIDTFNDLNQNYNLVAPLLEIENSLNESLKIISLVLSVFSVFSLISCMILLTITSYIKFIKSKKESAILILLGFNNYEIFRNSFYSNLFIGLISVVFALFSLIIGNVLISLIINKMIGGSNILLMNNYSVLLLISIIILLSFISSVFLIFKIRKIDINKELHH